MNMTIDFPNPFKQYGLFFASAGHASLIDYPDAKGLQSIAARIYTDGGIVSAVYASHLPFFVLTYQP